MRSAEQLRAAWNLDTDLKVAWSRVLDSKEWDAVSTMIHREFTAAAAKAARSGTNHAPDGAIVRHLMRMEGAIAALQALQEACAPVVMPEQEPEEYDDAYIRKLMEAKQADR